MKNRVRYVTGWDEQGMYQKVYINDVKVCTINEVESVAYITENTNGTAKVLTRRNDEGTLGKSHG